MKKSPIKNKNLHLSTKSPYICRKAILKMNLYTNTYWWRKLIQHPE